MDRATLNAEWAQGRGGTGYRLLPQNAEMTRMAPGGAFKSEQDIVQFMSRVFYSQEGRRNNQVKIQVIRVGSLVGTCSVDCSTQDGSARAGFKYQPVQCTLVFEPGEAVKGFEIDLIDDDLFDTTLDFYVHLQNPRDCVLQADMTACKVQIFDDDLFPSTAFPQLREINRVDEGHLHDFGFRLLWAFMRFTFFHVPTIWWKSIVAVFLAQLGNAYYLMTIYLKVYLVDVCLNVKDESTLDRLLVPGSRSLTAALLGLAWVLPNIILVAADHFEMTVLEMGFHIRQHLRVNLFRKYLNYARHSRARVPIQDLKTSMMEDIPTLSRDGYLISFEILKKVCKVICVGWWLLKKHPRSGIPLAIYPTLMLLWLGSRYKRRLLLLKKTGDGTSDVQGWLLHAEASFDLVNDYGNRNTIVGKFQKVLADQRRLMIALKSFSFWSGIVIPWITILATGFYIFLAGQMVTEGELSLGSFLATINLYKDLGDRFDGIYTDFEALSEVIDPLSVITVQFNLETDLPARLEAHEKHEEYMLECIAQRPSLPLAPPALTENVFDSIPILMKDVQISAGEAKGKESSLASPRPGLSASCPQGSLVFVSGPSGSGKTTLLRMITSNRLPQQGTVLLPPHLRVVHVSSVPAFVKSMGLYANLVFGVVPSPDYPIYANQTRVLKILERLKLHQSWVWQSTLEDSADAVPQLSAEEELADGEEEPEGQLAIEDMPDTPIPSEEAWYNRMSRSEAKRLHLARAFIASPEVLVLHSPLSDLDKELAQDLAVLLREFVEERGIEMDPKTKHRRRRRTVFFSEKHSKELEEMADFTCALGDPLDIKLTARDKSREAGASWWGCSGP